MKDCANKLQRQNYSKISYRDILDWKTVNRYTVTHKCQYISRLDYVLRMLWVECNNVMQWGFITLISLACSFDLFIVCRSK